jgi:hypothetical protein
VINPLLTLRHGARQLRATRRASGVPVGHQLQQLAMVRFANGTARAEYFKYRLWRPELTTVERLSYTSQRERRLSERATNRHYAGWEREGKSTAANVLTAAGLPMAELLAEVDTNTTATVRSSQDLAALIAREGHRPFVIKPELGMQGDGIMVAMQGDADGVQLLSGEHLTIENLWQRMRTDVPVGWRIERWVEPHALVSGWRPGATPTIRLLTLVVGGEPMVHAASIKVPLGDSGVDNLAKGNLAAPVNLATGVVGAATDGTGNEWHQVHPNTGIAIAGIVVPEWKRTLDMVTRGAEATLPRRAMGWDVAPTAAGPVVLEANHSWCEKLVQLPSGRGLTHGPFIRLLHEAGAAGLLARRRQLSREWRHFEARALAGE